ILDQWLENHARNLGVFETGGQVVFRAQAPGEAHRLDIEVEPLQSELFAQRHIGRRIVSEAAAVEGRKRLYDFLRSLSLSGQDQRRKRIERVEQKVWIDLVAQAPQ